jgi:hypothetical protein
MGGGREMRVKCRISNQDTEMLNGRIRRERGRRRGGMQHCSEKKGNMGGKRGSRRCIWEKRRWGGYVRGKEG